MIPIFLLFFQRKCEQYWPDNVHDTYQPLETTLLVSFEEILPFADYEIKKLVVTNVSLKEFGKKFQIVSEVNLSWIDFMLKTNISLLFHFSLLASLGPTACRPPVLPPHHLPLPLPWLA